MSPHTNTDAATPIRVTAVATHPIQYVSPWFRYITAHEPALELTVLYGAVPAPEQQGVGFGHAFAWDVPLTEGYRFEVCSDSAGKRFDSDTFDGIDVPDLEPRLLATRPDVVLVAGWHSALQVRAIRVCREHGIPVLYRGDSTLYSGPRGLLRPFWAWRTRRRLAQFDGFLTVGADATDYLRRFGVAVPLIAPAPHAVDNARFIADAAVRRTPHARSARRAADGLAPEDFVVLFAGKFQGRKRPLDAVRAVAAMQRRAVLVMAGDGPLAAPARAEADRLGVRIRWRGFVNQAALPDEFAIADALLVSSTWESWGLIVNEALASGVPVVATARVAAAADLIREGVNGYVVPVGDIGAMAAKLDALASAVAHGHDFRAACQASVERSSYAAATRGLTTMARRVIQERRGAA